MLATNPDDGRIMRMVRSLLESELLSTFIRARSIIAIKIRPSQTANDVLATVGDSAVWTAPASLISELDVSKLADGAANDVLVTASDGTTVQWQSGLADAHIASNAELAVSKLADGAAYDVLGTSSDGTTVAWVSGLLNAHIGASAAISVTKLENAGVSAVRLLGTNASNVNVFQSLDTWGIVDKTSDQTISGNKTLTGSDNTALGSETFATAVTTTLGAIMCQRALASQPILVGNYTGGSDTYARFVAYVNGDLEWGAGTGARDVSLTRAAANVLQLASGDYLRVQQDPSNNDDVARKLYVDGKIAASIVDAKGDLIAATAADTVSRLAVGTDGQVLKALASAGTGLTWAANFQCKVGNFTQAAAASKSVTGVGFTPKFIVFVTQQATSATVGSMGVGFTDGTNMGLVTMRADGSAGDRRATSTYCVGDNSGGAFTGYASITSMDSDGFTLNFGSATSVNVYWLAVG